MEPNGNVKKEIARKINLPSLKRYLINPLYMHELRYSTIPLKRFEEFIDEKSEPLLEEAYAIWASINCVNARIGISSVHFLELFPGYYFDDEQTKSFIKISIDRILKEEFRSKLREIDFSMQGWLIARIMNFTHPLKFEHTFGKHYYFESLDVLIAYIRKLMDAIEKNKGKNFGKDYFSKAAILKRVKELNENIARLDAELSELRKRLD